MSSAASEQPITLTLSPRDAQWVAAALGIATTLLSDSASDDVTECNIDSLFQLFNDEYSSAEALALSWRTRALLPATSRLHFSDGPFAVPQPRTIQ